MRRAIAVLACILPITGCYESTDLPVTDISAIGASDGGVALTWPHVACDPLVPSHCLFPFPSNVYTVADDTSETGRRVAFRDEARLTAANGKKTSFAPFNRSDGFSAGGPLMAFFPGATPEGMPDPLHIDDSLSEKSKVVMISEAGERVPLWVELDVSGNHRDQSAFMIRPAVRLVDATRYIVGIRDVQGDSGPIEPSPAFRALRDRTQYDGAGKDSIDARRELYDDIFARLARAGMPREDTLLAWDFTTASRENDTGHVLAMRDEVLADFETTSPPYEVTKVTDKPFDGIAFEIQGTVSVPLYLTDTSVDGTLLLDEAGRPQVNPKQPTTDVAFELLIPNSASAKTPVSLLQYGHGLFGSPTEIEADHLRKLANDFRYAIFSIAQWGMSDADALPTAKRLGTGQLEKLEPMFDRLQQSQLNHLVVMRAMINGLAKDSEYADLIDESERYYYGASQGGIFGGTYMTLSTDVTRGGLDVMGQPYHLLLLRSVDFEQLESIMRLQFPDDRDVVLGLALAQMLWDRSEPNGYTRYLAKDTLPGTPAHQVLMRAAVGDHQVTTFGGQVMARTIGAKHVDTGVRDVFGLDVVKSVEDGASGYLEVDFGLPPEPLCDVPMDACNDPHGLGRKVDGALAQLDTFLRTGKIVNNCPKQQCKFPKLSGCEPGEDTPSCK